MATLSLPNITLGIPVWYIDPSTNTQSNKLKPCNTLTLVQPVVPTPAFSSVPKQPQHGPTLVAKAYGNGGKARKKGTQHKPPKPLPPCALCDVVSHATNNFPKIPHVKDVVTDTFPDSNIPKVHVTLTESDKKVRSLRTNYPCYLCDHYGHYSHHCPHLEYFHDTLQVIHK